MPPHSGPDGYAHDDLFMEVGFVNDAGELVTLRITRDAVPIARQKHWMVFDDFEVALTWDSSASSS